MRITNAQLETLYRYFGGDGHDFNLNRPKGQTWLEISWPDNDDRRYILADGTMQSVRPEYVVPV
jgi:hypothetical protein